MSCFLRKFIYELSKIGIVKGGSPNSSPLTRARRAKKIECVRYNTFLIRLQAQTVKIVLHFFSRGA